MNFVPFPSSLSTLTSPFIPNTETIFPISRYFFICLFLSFTKLYSGVGLPCIVGLLFTYRFHCREGFFVAPYIAFKALDTVSGRGVFK